MPTRIILVDDDQDDTYFFEEALSRTDLQNYTLTIFREGKSVFDFLLSITNEADLPELIVLDLNMPLMDGITLLSTIKRVEFLRDIPVFILTTSTSKEHERICRELGCVDYYIKPIRLQDLQKIVEDIFAKTV